ncbi:hypothetical protein A3H09_03420 [Candidatus Falkowbacteria bacterium RIFCSPLOWO2_12_FULL_45_13]|uniref:Uncharacterized protein n=1 Tax=Candidatus Falkowbacteria bacterium RIFCSPLOWO2_12_FULL_45_13 TaxID=1797991 RepID=A0A1F5SZD8_9BACT|nr:MAG: hypothetical protein A3H09_03420 [Candidatus Falkowbacteria bacterium RIFCSPLOWO2_12_FULL_45_13]
MEAVKANKSEVDAYLAKINKIGKTREEISAERAEKQRIKQEYPAQPGVSDNWLDDAPAGPPAPDAGIAPAGGQAGAGQPAGPAAGARQPGAAAGVTRQEAEDPMKARRRKALRMAELRGRENDIKTATGQPKPRPAAISVARTAAPAAETVVSEREPADTDYNEKVAEERKNIKLDQERVDWERYKEIKKGRFKPKGGMREPKIRPGGNTTEALAPAEEVVAPEPRGTEERGREQRQEITKTVETWIGRIFEVRPRGRAQQVLERRFRAGKAYNPDALMTQSQAVKALAEYLIEYERYKPSRAKFIARRDIRSIALTGDDVNLQSQIGVEQAVNPVQAEAGSGQKLDIRPTAEELEEMLGSERSQALSQAEIFKIVSPAAGAFVTKQDKAETGKKSSKGKVKREPGESGRSARRLRLRELEEAEFGEEGEEKTEKETDQSGDRITVGDEEKEPLTTVGSAFKQGEVKAKKKAEKPADASGQAETAVEAAAEAKPEVVDRKQGVSAPTISEWLKIFDFKANPEVKRWFVSPNNKNQKFNKKDPITKEQAVEAGVGYLMGTSQISEVAARDLLKKAIEAKRTGKASEQ